MLSMRLAYFAGEYAGGADLLLPYYFAEVEFRNPKDRERKLQGPRPARSELPAAAFGRLWITARIVGALRFQTADGVPDLQQLLAHARPKWAGGLDGAFYPARAIQPPAIAVAGGFNPR